MREAVDEVLGAGASDIAIGRSPDASPLYGDDGPDQGVNEAVDTVNEISRGARSADTGLSTSAGTAATVSSLGGKGKSKAKKKNEGRKSERARAREAAETGLGASVGDVMLVDTEDNDGGDGNTGSCARLIGTHLLSSRIEMVDNRRTFLRTMNHSIVRAR